MLCALALIATTSAALPSAPESDWLLVSASTPPHADAAARIALGERQRVWGMMFGLGAAFYTLGVARVDWVWDHYGRFNAPREEVSDSEGISEVLAAWIAFAPPAALAAVGAHLWLDGTARLEGSTPSPRASTTLELAGWGLGSLTLAAPFAATIAGYPEQGGIIAMGALAGSLGAFLLACIVGPGASSPTLAVVPEVGDGHAGVRLQAAF